MGSQYWTSSATDTRLLTAPFFVVSAKPDLVYRLALKLIRRPDLKAANVITDREGHKLGSIRDFKPWGFNVPDLRLDVLDSAGALVLALEAQEGKLQVSGADGAQVGVVDWRNHFENIRAHRLVDMDVHFCGPDGEVGRLVPRLPPHIYQAKGRFEIADPSGVVVARTEWHGFRQGVELPPSVSDPLRSLAIAFACAQVNRTWITYRPKKRDRP